MDPFGKTGNVIPGNIVYSFIVLVYSCLFMFILYGPRKSTPGVFCSTAIETATADKDVATIKQIRAKAQQAVNIIGALGEGHLMSFE